MAEPDLIERLAREAGVHMENECFLARIFELRRFASLAAAEGANEAIDLLRWALGELAAEFDNNAGKALSERYWTDEGRAKLARAIELTGFKEPT